MITIKFHPSANILAVQGADKFIEIFYLRAADEIKRKIARRRKREKAKQTKTGEVADPDEEVTITASDEISHYQTLITTAKVRSFDFSPADDAMKTGIVHVRVEEKVIKTKQRSYVWFALTFTFVFRF